MFFVKQACLTAVAVACLSLLIVSARANRTAWSGKTAFGIEVALDKPLYIPASMVGRGMSAVVRTPMAENVSNHEALSAVKLVPIMDGDKVKVIVTGLIGDTSGITKCSQWDSLKTVDIATYVAGLDEEVAILKLSDHGVLFETGPLKFRVVPRKVFPQMPILEGTESAGCGCASCGRLQCCPNPGQCITSCGTCGAVCCNQN